MQEIILNAEIRDNTGKHAKYSRKRDMVPGVYYSHGEGNISIEVSKLALEQLVFTSEAHVIDLKLKDGRSKKCIIRDVQYDPVSDKPIHFDLQGLKENEKVMVEIPVTLTGGVPAGVRDGGMLQHFIHRVRVSCLPKDIPQRIEINVAELAINHFVHIRDLQIPNVMILDAADTTVAGVMPPHVVKEAEVVAPTEVAAAEPEVLAKGKKVEEGEAGAEAPKGEKKAEEKEKK
jgi:large subunit ribosomal protein L25